MDTFEPITRADSPALNEIMADPPVPVLDKGFVRLIDYMGNEEAIVQAARVSYGMGTKAISSDRGLLRRLMRDRHTSPFEMCEIKLHVKLPIFVARQWVRHRTANVNEYSGRFSVMKNEFYLPAPQDIAYQSAKNKQGRDGVFDPEMAEDVRNAMHGMASSNFMTYETWIHELDLSRELARINLPLSTYTEWYWKVDLHNLLHFLRLRADPHAQKEIRVYADVIGNMVAEWMPMVWEAFLDYQLQAVTLSRMEMVVIRNMLAAHGPAMTPVEFETTCRAVGMTINESADLWRHLGGAPA